MPVSNDVYLRRLHGLRALMDLARNDPELMASCGWRVEEVDGAARELIEETMAEMATLNGAAHHQSGGRAVPDYPSYTFAASGRTVQVRKLSPMTMQRITQQVRKDMPPPQPPVIEVELDGGVKTQETNDADPAYHAALREYRDQFNVAIAERLMRLLASYALVSNIPTDEVAAYRAAMDAAGVPVDDESDAWVYLWEMCVTSEADIKDFQAFVLSMAQPTPEAVQAHVDSFRGDV